LVPSSMGRGTRGVPPRRFQKSSGKGEGGTKSAISGIEYGGNLPRLADARGVKTRGGGSQKSYGIATNSVR